MNTRSLSPVMHIAMVICLCALVSTVPALSKGTPKPTAPPSKSERKALEQQAIRQAVTRGELVSLPKILLLAQKQVPGDVIEVELEQEGASLVYEVKILTGIGRVSEVKLNARTGAVVKNHND